MKKLSFLTALILMAFVGFFSGCTDTTDKVGPTLEFFGGNYIDEDVTVEPGGVLAFSWLATKGDGNLTSFSIERDGVTLAGYPDTDIPNDSYQGTVELEAPLNEMAYVYEFIVTDNNDLTASQSFTITVEQTGGPIDEWSATLGSYDAAEGSSFASSTGVVYQMADATTHSDIIDFLYFYGASNHATLAAPFDAAAADVFPAVADWSTKNETKFKTTSLDAAAFDAITDDLVIIDNATGATNTKVNGLAAGDVVAFVTDATVAKMGLIKIVSITGEGAGKIVIAVKVQQ
jgi:hypothetical protein